MKIEDNEFLKDETEIHAQAEIKSQIKKLGSIVLHPGQRIYKVNVKNLDCEEAKYEGSNSAILDGKKVVKAHRKIIVEEGFYYIPAINKKNARKKFVKKLGEMREEAKKKRMNGTPT